MSGGLDSTEKRVLQTLVDTSAELSTVWSMKHVLIIIHFLLKYLALPYLLLGLHIYRVENKQKIRDYKTQPYHCECGRVIQLDKKARHCTSNVHIDSIKQNKKITISQEDYDLLVYCDSLMLSSKSYTNFIISQ